MDNILSISNVVNVTVTSTPLGIGEPNVNNVALFTHEDHTFAEEYQIYKSAGNVQKDYGTDTRAYKMAANMFAQNPNMLSGGGQLIAVPLIMTTTPATSGGCNTIDLTSNLAAIIALDSASLQVHSSSGVKQFDEVDLTGASTTADLANLFQASLDNFVTVTAVGNVLHFADTATGSTSLVAIDVFGTAAGTDLYGAAYLDGAQSTVTAGTDSGTSAEALADAMARAKALINFTGVATTLTMTGAQVKAAASSVQAADAIFVYPFHEVSELDDTIKDIKDASQSKTRSLYYSAGEDEAFDMCGAYIGRMFSVDFAASNSTITANMKALANVLPDGGLTEATYQKAKDNGADAYPSYNGIPRTMSSGANSYFDRVYNQQQFKYALQTAGFNYLSTNTKIAQTTQGMDGLKAAFRKVCEQYVRNGYIAAGVWNSADKFGDPEDFMRNIEDFGFYIYSLPIGQQSQADREDRVAPTIQIAIKEAGAIHSVIVNVIAEP